VLGADAANDAVALTPTDALDPVVLVPDDVVLVPDEVELVPDDVVPVVLDAVVLVLGAVVVCVLGAAVVAAVVAVVAAVVAVAGAVVVGVAGAVVACVLCVLGASLVCVFCCVSVCSGPRGAVRSPPGPGVTVVVSGLCGPPPGPLLQIGHGGSSGTAEANSAFCVSADMPTLAATAATPTTCFIDIRIRPLPGFGPDNAWLPSRPGGETMPPWSRGRRGGVG
jgi:hypothetical protein